MQPPITIESLVEQLRSVPSPAIVGVEGFMGSGKTHIAKSLAAALNWPVLHLDDYVTPQDDHVPYAERLDYEQLAIAFDSTPRVLVEGICLRQALSQIAKSPTVHIYVKRMSPSGLWHDGIHLQDYESSSVPTPHEAHKSDLAYHLSDQPHERAKYIVNSAESASEF